MAGSTYGNIFRITTWGESHGKGVGVVVDGCPAGLELCEADIQKFLNKPNRMNVTETIVILILFSFRWFPLLQALLQRVSYNRFVELEKEVLLPMAIFCWEPVLVNFVDSTPLHVCRNQRILIHKIFEGLAEHGKCSMKCFFGFKLHVIINDKGKILNFMFTL